jgi:hypothetical protein
MCGETMVEGEGVRDYFISSPSASFQFFILVLNSLSVAVGIIFVGV